MALRYWITGGTGNWNNNTNWSSASNGSSGATVPTSPADDAYFDSASGVGTVTITTGAAAGSIYFTNPVSGSFGGTLNMAANLTFGLNLRLSSGMTITNTFGLIKTGNGGSISSNGKVWPNNFQTPTGGGFATTLNDDFTILGNFNGAPSTINFVGSGGTRTITVGGSLTVGAGLSCTNIAFVMDGTGNVTFNGVYINPSITINKSSGIITQTAPTSFVNVTFNYSGGTFNSTAPISIGGINNTFNNVSGITFSGISFAATAGQTLILNSDMNVGGNLTTTGVAGTINGPYTIFVGSGITPTATIQGTATIEMNGSNNATIFGGTISNNLIINKSSAATVTLSGNLTYGAVGRTFQLTSGLMNPSTGTVTIPNNTSVTLNNLNFWNLTINGGNVSNTITQNTKNTIQNNLTLASFGTVTFSGTAGWDCANLLCSTPNRLIVLQEGNTYNTSTSVNMVGADLQRITMSSSSVTNRAIWTLDPTASQSIVYVNGTRIDSSLGQTIWSFGGTLNDTINWNLGSQPQTIAFTFIG